MSADEKKTALFAGLIMQQSNMALMFLGKTPHPETGQPMKDLESARFFIDQLEVIEEKTRGNLTSEEQRMLNDALTRVRMAFVETINQGDQAPAASAPGAPSTPSQTADASKPEPPPGPSDLEPGASEPESRKKFTKKY